MKQIIITTIIVAVVHFVLTFTFGIMAIMAGLAAIDNREPPSVIDLVAEPVARILVEPGEFLWGQWRLANRSEAGDAVTDNCLPITDYCFTPCGDVSG